MLARSPAAPRTIAFTIPGEAVPFARAGGGKTVARFTPAKQRSAMGQVKFYCQRAMGPNAVPIEGPVELSVSAIYLRPKSQKNARWKTSRPDADNLSKLLKDALNKVAWRDDAQVVSLHMWKQYGDVAKVVVRIVELPE
jgi:Holliday junction resolvase RusA-like endonuclease